MWARSLHAARVSLSPVLSLRPLWKVSFTPLIHTHTHTPTHMYTCRPTHTHPLHPAHLYTSALPLHMACPCHRTPRSSTDAGESPMHTHAHPRTPTHTHTRAHTGAARTPYTRKCAWAEAGRGVAAGVCRASSGDRRGRGGDEADRVWALHGAVGAPVRAAPPYPCTVGGRVRPVQAVP